MELPFPFGFPAPTAFYLSLYVATLVVHVVFMNYVLAGTAYLAAFALLRRRGQAPMPGNDLAAPLRDWMPFMLSAAITAGVAPLLFIQILYQRQFYTANLLLFHRWMAILPVLIVGFYLLYLLKSRLVSAAPFEGANKWDRHLASVSNLGSPSPARSEPVPFVHNPLAWRAAVGCGAFACFGFVAWSWTENHLLSLDEPAWPGEYASDRLFYRNRELWPRLMVWFTGAFPTMAAIVAWQLWYLRRKGNELSRDANRICSILAMAGLVAAALSSAVYVFGLSADLRGQLLSPAYRWYLPLAATGLIVQLGAWLAGWRQDNFGTRRLCVISAGTVAAIVGATVLREGRRLAAIDVTRLYDLHADAASVGGLTVFLVFAAINVVLIAWCFLLVRGGLRKPEERKG